MRPEEARSVLETNLEDRLAEPVVLRFEESTWAVQATDVGADPDEAAGVAAAMEIGRTGGMRALGDRFLAWFGPFDVAVPVSSDATLTASALERVSGDIDRAPRDASVVIEDGKPRLEPSEVGLAVRADALREGLLAAFISDQREVEIDVGFVPVSVTDEDARQALADAERMVSDPVIVRYEDRSWEFSTGEIAEWLSFRAVSATESSAAAEATAAAAAQVASGALEATSTPGNERKVLEVYVDVEKAEETIEERVGSAGRAAVDATFKVGGGVVTIIPSQDGVGPDVESLAREMTRVLKTDAERTVELRTRRVEPGITTDDARAMGIKERISTYTTTFAASNKPRVNNIHTLADALDGTLLAPGATFSFNDTIGPRTAEKGYQEAPAIVNGVLVPQLGGGICQVGTTIFNTVFESGLPVVERKNHSFYISHYPKGRDATVSFGGPDFKFKNDTDHFVLIAVGYSNSSLTISLYGTDPGYDVRSETGAWTGVKPHPVKEIKDPSMPAGTRVIEDAGVDGRTIVVTRTVLHNGTVVREDSFRSVYKPKEETVRVGTKVVPSEVSTATVE
jgi:vancomycin resistance protein YoaR